MRSRPPMAPFTLPPFISRRSPSRLLGWGGQARTSGTEEAPMTIRVVDEAESRRLVDEALALESAREAFIASVGGGAVYPVVVAPVTEDGHRFTVKSGASGTSGVIQIGSHWP